MARVNKKRIISLILVILFLSGSLTSACFAENYYDQIEESEELSALELETAQLSEGDLPEAIDKAIADSNNNVHRLYSQETDLNTVIFQNKDGSKTMYYFKNPVKYITEGGVTKDKSRVLKRIQDPQYIDCLYYTPFNDVQSYYPRSLCSTNGIRIEYGDYSIQVMPMTDYNAQAELVLPETKDNYVEYSDIFGKGYSLRYYPCFNGFKDEIIIENKGIIEFSFLLEMKGLEASLNNRCVSLKTNEGYCLGEISPVGIFDSAEVPNISENASVLLSSLGKAGCYKYSIILDEDYLSNPEIVFPVVIDPTFTINASGSGTTKTIIDTPVYSNVPTSCQGSNIYNVIGNANGISNNYGVGRTLMKFPGLINSAVFQSINSNQVSSMKLYMYSATSSTNTSTISINYYTGVAWNETSTAYNSVTWNGYGNLITSSSVASGYNWVSFELKTAFSAWQNSSDTADLGVMLRNSNESSTSYVKGFYSTESNNKPYLSLTWLGTTPSGISPGNLYRLYNPNTSKYFSATSSTSITQSSTVDSSYGYQLWRITSVSTGVYRIESLGVRMSTYSKKASMLTASANSTSSTTGTLSLTEYSASNTKQWWYINKVDQGYTFVNYYYPQLVISVSNSSSAPTLTSSPTYQKWVLSSVSYSDYWPGGYLDASAPYIVDVIIQPSAVTGYLTEEVYSIATEWNGIENNIVINYYPSTYSGQYAAADLLVSVIGSSSMGSNLGQMIPDPNNFTVNWSSALIKINTTSAGTNNSECHLEDRQMNFLHELGHALKLVHPHENSLWHPLSIMNQGLPINKLYIPCRPSGYDKYSLSKKW